MAIGHVKRMHECFPKHVRMGPARIKYDKETEKGKERGDSMEASNVGPPKN